MKKIVFLISDLGFGGAQRGFLNIVAGLEKGKYEPIIICYQNKQGFGLPENIKSFQLDIQSNRSKIIKVLNFVRRFVAIRKLLKEIEPEYVISTFAEVNILSVLLKIVLNIDCKNILSEMTTPSMHFQGKIMMLFLIRFFYKRADQIVAVSNGVKNDLIDNFAIPDERIIVINNPIDISLISKMANEAIEGVQLVKNLVINMSHLTALKGQSVLVDAFKKIQNRADANLVIIGEGPEERRLMEQIKNLGLCESIKILGYQKNPFKILKNATVFVLSSFWEGLPTVILESMACGVPVISTDCKSGPSEIIQDGYNGMLVPVGNSELMADKIFQLLSSEKLRASLIENGKKTVSEYAMDKIAKKYSEMVFN